jgi:hypothetical protein
MARLLQRTGQMMTVNSNFSYDRRQRSVQQRTPAALWLKDAKSIKAIREGYLADMLKKTGKCKSRLLAFSRPVACCTRGALR